MDEAYKMQLIEQLSVERRLLAADKMTRAKYGISCDPAIIIRIEDREREIAILETRLGITWRAPVRREIDEPPPQPRQQFEWQIAAQQKRARQQDIEHQMTLLRTHRANLAHYRSQARAFGGIELAPPITRHGLNEGRDGISRCKDALRQLSVAIDDLPGDE